MKLNLLLRGIIEQNKLKFPCCFSSLLSSLLLYLATSNFIREALNVFVLQNKQQAKVLSSLNNKDRESLLQEIERLKSNVEELDNEVRILVTLFAFMSVYFHFMFVLIKTVLSQNCITKMFLDQIHPLYPKLGHLLSVIFIPSTSE